MQADALRYTLAAMLLHNRGPVALGELAHDCGVTSETAAAELERMAAEHAVVRGQWLPGVSDCQFCWAGGWAKPVWVRPPARARPLAPEIDSDLATAFHNFVIHDYRPPGDKRLLVILQCAVRRPFSTAPSHASMRRAVQVATGFDPAKDFAECPVHAVVMASKLGPVPYELEDVFPANVGGPGVKKFGDTYYAYVKPILVDRMAEYVAAHRGSYDRIAAFGEGRYHDVIRSAFAQAGVDAPVFPNRRGARIIRMGRTCIRYYWLRYWIQLFLEIVSWLPPEAQASARERLRALDVEYTGLGP